MLEDRARRVRPRHVGLGEVGADTGRLTSSTLYFDPRTVKS
jgi:hypothetical protein